MSATFWNMRRRKAAELAKKQSVKKIETPAAEEKKPLKKVKKNG